MIRGHFPGVTIRVRLDGGFANPAVLEFLDAQSKLEYVVSADLKGSQSGRFGCEPESWLMVAGHTNASAAVGTSSQISSL